MTQKAHNPPPLLPFWWQRSSGGLQKHEKSRLQFRYAFPVHFVNVAALVFVCFSIIPCDWLLRKILILSSQTAPQTTKFNEREVPVSNKKRENADQFVFQVAKRDLPIQIHASKKKMADSPHIRHKISNAGMALLGHTAIRQQTTRPYITLQSCNSSSLVSLQSVSFRQFFGGSPLFIHEGTKQIWPTWRILERLCVLERNVVACYVYIKKKWNAYTTNERWLFLLSSLL